MDKTTLVEKDFEQGKLLISELDNAHVNVHSAFWLYNSQENYWRLIIASKSADIQSPKRVYSEIKRVLNRMESENNRIDISLQNISVISPNHPINNILSLAIKTGSTISGIRFTGNTINNNYIEDAYIYRIQPPVR